MDTENTSPDDLVGKPEEEAAASPEATAETQPEGKSEQDTGETAEVQAEAGAGEPPVASEATPQEQTPATSPEPPTKAALVLPSWVKQISRYHNDMNGLLAAKENLKIMAVDKSVRHSFYKKWVFEANQYARLTVNLRHRKRRALERIKREAEDSAA